MTYEYIDLGDNNERQMKVIRTDGSVIMFNLRPQNPTWVVDENGELVLGDNGLPQTTLDTTHSDVITVLDGDVTKQDAFAQLLDTDPNTAFSQFLANHM